MCFVFWLFLYKNNQNTNQILNFFIYNIIKNKGILEKI